MADIFVPTLLRIGSYQFFIVMYDCAERRHVHVRGGGFGDAKVWLESSIEVAAVKGYTPREMHRIEAVVREYRDTLIRRWNEECEGDPI